MFIRRCVCFVGLILIALLALARCARAEDAFYDIPLSELKITAGELPQSDRITLGWNRSWDWAEPSAILDQPGEAYLRGDSFTRPVGAGNVVAAPRTRLHLRGEKGKDLTGRLMVRFEYDKPAQLLKFSVPASAAQVGSKGQADAAMGFYNAKLDYNLAMMRHEIPGRAWFRHEARDAQDELAKRGKNTVDLDEQARLGRVRSPIDAYDLFSGGRAISENLQLDRGLRDTAKDREQTVPIGTLTGITVASINWKPLLEGAKPALDPLAKYIPADQHVLFFPSFAAAAKLSDEVNSRIAGATLVANPQAEDIGVFQKYEQQLGIGMTAIGRIVGPRLIKSIAVTGSDPYFPTGTDVAVLFECNDPELLSASLQFQILRSARPVFGARQIEGTEAGVKYHGFRSPNREVCSYVAELKGAVVVTNSLAQLKQLAKVADANASIAALDEYKFFRTRYPLGDKDETAFLFMSDAAIRRWCSPQWRIASARRTQNAAALAELTAEHAGELQSASKPSPSGRGKGEGAGKKLNTDLALVDAGDLSLTTAGVFSSKQGGLEFMTPIIEMPIEKVTVGERDAYNRWRDQYQSNWRWAFDPIALRLGIGDEKLTADLTVMPLIAGSDYRQYIAVSRGAEITNESGDPHPALARYALAINKDSEPMRRWGTLAAGLTPGVRIEPFDWLGTSVSVYVDDDPIWEKLRNMPEDERQKFLRHNPGSLPVGFHADVSNGLKLTAFLTAARAFIEQAAPNMLTWESPAYREQSYVRVRANDSTRRMLTGDEGNDLSLYYFPSPAGLTLTLNEDLLKRAIDRQLDKKQKKDDAKPAMPWLGKNLCLQIDRKMFDILTSGAGIFFGGDVWGEALRRTSWNNLPILNEWKRLFPNEDPIAVHERIWHTKLVCPGLGKYIWNDEWKTMESTVYGHPGEPKIGPRAAAAMLPYKNVNFGLTFEEQGLRAKAELLRETTLPAN